MSKNNCHMQIKKKEKKERTKTPYTWYAGLLSCRQFTRTRSCPTAAVSVCFLLTESFDLVAHCRATAYFMLATRLSTCGWGAERALVVALYAHRAAGCYTQIFALHTCHAQQKQQQKAKKKKKKRHIQYIKNETKTKQLLLFFLFPFFSFLFNILRSIKKEERC